MGQPDHFLLTWLKGLGELQHLQTLKLSVQLVHQDSVIELCRRLNRCERLNKLQLKSTSELLENQTQGVFEVLQLKTLRSLELVRFALETRHLVEFSKEHTVVC
jgi:hypothetical protein